MQELKYFHHCDYLVINHIHVFIAAVNCLFMVPFSCYLIRVHGVVPGGLKFNKQTKIWLIRTQITCLLMIISSTVIIKGKRLKPMF